MSGQDGRLARGGGVLAAELGVDCLAGAVDERVVVVQDGCDIRSGQKCAEFEGELVGVGAGGEFVRGMGLAGRLRQELLPLPLVEGDAVAYWPCWPPISADAVTKKQPPGNIRCST